MADLGDLRTSTLNSEVERIKIKIEKNANKLNKPDISQNERIRLMTKSADYKVKLIKLQYVITLRGEMAQKTDVDELKKELYERRLKLDEYTRMDEGDANSEPLLVEIKAIKTRIRELTNSDDLNYSENETKLSYKRVRYQELIKHFKKHYNVPKDYIWIVSDIDVNRLYVNRLNVNRLDGVSTQLFDTSEYTLSDLIYKENGFSILNMCLLGRYMKGINSNTKFILEDLQRGSKFCFLSGKLGHNNTQNLENFRVNLLNKLPNERYNITVSGDTVWSLENPSVRPIIDSNHEFDKYIQIYLNGKFNTPRDLKFSITIPKTPDLLLLKSTLSRNGPKIKVPQSKENTFIISHDKHDYIFPLDILKEKSKYFLGYTETKIGNNNNEYISEFSDEAIIYFQDYIYKKIYNYDEKLPWLRKNFDVSIITELFEMMNYFLLNDEVYGTELLKIIYYYKDDIENLDEFMMAIREIHVSDEWSEYHKLINDKTLF